MILVMTASGTMRFTCACVCVEAFTMTGPTVWLDVEVVAGAEVWLEVFAVDGGSGVWLAAFIIAGGGGSEAWVAWVTRVGAVTAGAGNAGVGFACWFVRGSAGPMA